MALVRRHWKLALLNVLIFAAALVTLVIHFSNSRTTVAAVTSSPPTQANSQVDPVTYGDIADLRVRLCLTNEDLAALGCSQEQTNEVLGQLLQWYKANQTQFMQAQQAEATASSSYQELARRVNIGPRSDVLLGQIAPARQQVFAAIGQRTNLISGAVTAVSTKLSEGQNQSWKVCRNNPGLPRRFRYLGGLGAQESKQLSFALSKYGEGSPQAKAAEQAITGGSNAPAAQGVADNLQDKMDGVLAAEREVLPVPSTLVVALQRPASPVVPR